jgi:hypothetical protein
MTVEAKVELRVARRRSGRFVWEIATHRGAGIVVRSSGPQLDFETEAEARLAGQAVLDAQALRRAAASAAAPVVDH